MEKRLREYQQKCINTIYKRLSQGVNKQLVVMATGTGKTFTAVKAVSNPQLKRKLWTTHTEELLEQSGAAFIQELFPGADIAAMIDTYGGLTEYVRYVQSNPLFKDQSEASIANSLNVIKADLFGLDGEITLASAQTLYRRLDRIPYDTFDAIICDESHLFGSVTFNKPLQYLQPKLLLGLTATPHRMDGVMLGDIFDEISFQYNIGDAIVDGYLAELDAIRVKTETDLTRVRTTAGELNQKDLRETVDNPVRNKLLVEKYKQYANGKQNIVFCVDIEHAKNVCAEFQNAGESAEVLVGDESVTPDRKGTIKRFKRGDVTHLVNVMIATAGFDHPQTGCITMACPTKSLTKFMQQVGRGTRTWPGTLNGLEFSSPEERRKAILTSPKPKCVILDIVDVSGRHRLINTFELDKEKPIKDRIFTTQEKKDKLLDAEKQRKQTFIGRQLKHDARIDLLQLPKVKLSNSFKMKDPATEKQIEYLKRLGYGAEGQSYTKAQANELISYAPATDAQIYALGKFGYDVSKGVSRGEAERAFAEIKEREEKKKIMAQGKTPFSDVF
jgi:superfamily II DNA or RNA helicase